MLTLIERLTASIVHDNIQVIDHSQMLPKSGAFTQRKVDSYTTAASTIALESIPSTETVVIPLIGDEDGSGLYPNEPIVHRDNPARIPDNLVTNVTANERKTLL